MEVGEVRVAEDNDFDLLKIYLSRNDGWKLEYDKGSTMVWTRSNPREDPSNPGSEFKMIRVKTKFSDVQAPVLYDVLQDPLYRKHWDKFMMESYEIGHLNPNNNIFYYALSCPPPMKNRDFIIQSSWLETSKEFIIINHSVYHKDHPQKKGFIRGISYLSGFLVKPLKSGGCEVSYLTHTNPRGNLPSWACNKLSSTFAPKLVRKLHKASLNYTEWKRANGGSQGMKPWLYPEQIVSKRININDCQIGDPESLQRPKNSLPSSSHSPNSSPSPEESLPEDFSGMKIEAYFNDEDDDEENEVEEDESSCTSSNGSQAVRR